MRIGTWNMDGKGTRAHVEFLAALKCDVLLLTEVPHGLDLGGGKLEHSESMGATKDWAAVCSRSGLTARESPHGWSAAAEVNGALFVSSVLPWRLVKRAGHWPGPEATTGERLDASLAQLGPLLRSHRGPVVWGGDFNHGLVGPDYAGSAHGRDSILRLLDELGLVAPTAELGHPIAGQSNIDHIAVPAVWGVVNKQRVVAERTDGRRLSDHDAYVVETAG